MDKAKRSQKRQAVKPEESGGAGKPVSFHPLSFDEALDGLLAVKPEPKGEPKETKKRAAKKKRLS